MKSCCSYSSWIIVACLVSTLVAATQECQEGICLNQFNKHLVEISLITNSGSQNRIPIELLISYRKASRIVWIKTTCTRKIVQNFPMNVEYFNLSVFDTRFSFNHINGSRPSFFRKQFHINKTSHRAIARPVNQFLVPSKFFVGCLAVSYWLFMKGTAKRATTLKTHNILKVVRQHTQGSTDNMLKDRSIILDNNDYIAIKEFKRVMHNKNFYRDRSDLMVLATRVVKGDNQV